MERTNPDMEPIRVFQWRFSPLASIRAANRIQNEKRQLARDYSESEGLRIDGECRYRINECEMDGIQRATNDVQLHDLLAEFQEDFSRIPRRRYRTLSAGL